MIRSLVFIVSVSLQSSLQCVENNSAREQTASTWNKEQFNPLTPTVATWVQL